MTTDAALRKESRTDFINCTQQEFRGSVVEGSAVLYGFP